MSKKPVKFAAIAMEDLPPEVRRAFIASKLPLEVLERAYREWVYTHKEEK